MEVPGQQAHAQDHGHYSIWPGNAVLLCPAHLQEPEMEQHFNRNQTPFGDGVDSDDIECKELGTKKVEWNYMCH